MSTVRQKPIRFGVGWTTKEKSDVTEDMHLKFPCISSTFEFNFNSRHHTSIWMHSLWIYGVSRSSTFFPVFIYQSRNKYEKHKILHCLKFNTCKVLYKSAYNSHLAAVNCKHAIYIYIEVLFHLFALIRSLNEHTTDNKTNAIRLMVIMWKRKKNKRFAHQKTIAKQNESERQKESEFAWNKRRNSETNVNNNCNCNCNCNCECNRSANPMNEWTN